MNTLRLATTQAQDKQKQWADIISLDGTVVDAVCCPWTGIVYSISTAGVKDCIGMEYVLKHPLSHVNLVRRNALHFSARAVGLTEAAGSLFTVLRHYGLLVLHEDKPAVVYKANKALGLGYTKKGLNAAVYELLVNEERLSAACKGIDGEALGVLPRFDLSSVLACGNECKGEEGYFTQCFKSWLRDIKAKAGIGVDIYSGHNGHNGHNGHSTVEAGYVTDRLEKDLKAQAEREYASQLIGMGTSTGGGDRQTVEQVLEGRVNKMVDNINRASCRKSNESVTVKVKGQLRYAMTHDIISATQYKLLIKHIRATHVPASIVEYVRTQLYKYLIENVSSIITLGKEQPSSGWEFQRTMKVMTTYAWFTALTANNLYAGLEGTGKASAKVTANSFALVGEGQGSGEGSVEATPIMTKKSNTDDAQVKPAKATTAINLLDLL